MRAVRYVLPALLVLAVATPPAAADPLLVEAFDGPDGVYADQSWFWAGGDRGRSREPDLFALSGDYMRVDGQAVTSSDFARLYSWRDDLANTTLTVDVRLDGYTSGSADWHGINLWMNESLCEPVPSCSAVDDGAGGNGGYALDFANRGGFVEIMKKVPGDVDYPGAVSQSNGGTYYVLDRATWAPVEGRTYELTGEVRPVAGGLEVRVLVDGAEILSAVDTGEIGGPPLTGGRVGLRSDFARVAWDDLVVERATAPSVPTTSPVPPAAPAPPPIPTTALPSLPGLDCVWSGGGWLCGPSRPDSTPTTTTPVPTTTTSQAPAQTTTTTTAPAPVPEPTRNCGGFRDDVPATSAHCEHIADLADLGIIEGYTDGTFRPHDPVTRAEVATMLNRLLERLAGG